MPEQDDQVTFEQLPPKVQHSFADLRASLAPALTLGNYRRMRDGWVASIFTRDGHNGGDYMVLDDLEEKSHE